MNPGSSTTLHPILNGIKRVSVLVVTLFALPPDFQNMPNAMRPSAPRPQAFNAIRPTTTANTQVPRMMASQRMRKYYSCYNFKFALFCFTVIGFLSYDVMLIM